MHYTDLRIDLPMLPNLLLDIVTGAICTIPIFIHYTYRLWVLQFSLLAF